MPPERGNELTTTTIQTEQKTNSAMPELILRVQGVSKRYGSVTALKDMQFELRPGEVHVLFGENGAGKSTLINVISGAIRPNEGTLHVAGKPVDFHSVHDARAHGIAAMFQEFSLAPHLSVEENVFLGSEPSAGIWLKRGERRRLVQEAMAQFGFELDSQKQVIHLTRAQAQMVEMTKALMVKPRILILDEPTASLSQRETEAMFELVYKLRAQGVGIIYITHRIKEIEEIGDRVTVMRDGMYIDTVDVATSSHDTLVELMTGRSFESFYPDIKHEPGDVRLKIHELASQSGGVQHCSLEVRAREIVGLAGLVGCGKSRIGRAVFGLEKVASGEITVNGEKITQATPRKMLAKGVAYVTSDRHKEGLMLARSTKENLTLTSLSQPNLSSKGWLKTRQEKTFAQSLGERMGVKPLALTKPVSAYSGGNQQKVLIGKSLAREANVIIFDEPTVGVDVGARVEVYQFLKELAEAGAAIVIISSDMPEVLNMSHRLYVVRDGMIVDSMDKADIDETRVLQGFFGTEDTQLQNNLEGARHE